MSHINTKNDFADQISARPEALGEPPLADFLSWHDRVAVSSRIEDDEGLQRICRLTARTNDGGGQPSAPQAVFFRRFGTRSVPNVDPTDPLTKLPPLTDWNLGRAEHGYISLTVDQAFDLGLLTPEQRRTMGATVVAAALCIPIALAPVQASAGGPSRIGGEVGADAPIEVLAAATPRAAGDDASAVAEAAATAATATAPSGPIPDATWQALMGRQVQVTTADGYLVIGELAGFDELTATLINAQGKVIVVDKTRATGVTVLQGTPTAAPAPAPGPAPAPAPTAAPAPQPLPPPTVPPNHGVGLVATGAVLMGVGGVMMISGAVLTGLAAVGYFGYNDCTTSYYGSYTCDNVGGTPPSVFALGVLLPGVIVMFGVGLPLLAVGSGMRKKAKAQHGLTDLLQKHRVSLSPTYQRRTESWGGGLSFQF